MPRINGRNTDNGKQRGGEGGGGGGGGEDEAKNAPQMCFVISCCIPHTQGKVKLTLTKLNTFPRGGDTWGKRAGGGGGGQHCCITQQLQPH